MSETLVQLQRIQGVQSAAIVTRTGAIVDSSHTASTQQELAGSLAAAIFGAVGQSLEKIDLGSLSNCMFEGKTGALHMLGSGDHVLLVVASKQANSGLVRLGLQRAAATLQG